MRYWIFVKNSVSGPFTIKEIVENNYLSPDLLVCPSETVATKPSNWYFARELFEFEPYLKTKTSLAVDDFDISEIVKSFEKSKTEFLEKDFDFNIEDIVKQEMEKLEIKEKDKYIKKIESLEGEIKNLNNRLNKALSIIDDYEKKFSKKEDLPSVDGEIKRITELEENIKTLENKLSDSVGIINRYEKELQEKDELIERMKDEIKSIKENYEAKISSLEEKVKKYEKEIEEFKQKLYDMTVQQKVEETVSVDRSVLNDKSETKLEDIGFEKETALEHALSESIFLDSLNSNKEELAEKESKIITQEGIYQEIKENVKEDLTQLDTEQTLEESTPKTRELKPVSFDLSLTQGENEKDFIDIAVDEPKLKKSEGIILENIPFQVADVNLEKVETKLDEIEHLRIEPVDRNIPIKPTVEEEKTARVNVEGQQNVSEETIGALNLDLSLEKSISKKDVDEIKSTSQEEFGDKIKDRQQGSILKEVVEHKKETVLKDKVKTYQPSQVKKKRKTTVLSLIIIGGSVVLLLSLILILRSPFSVSNRQNIAAKNNIQAQSTKLFSQDISTHSVIQDTTAQSNIQDVSLSKISENVKRAIDIVKNYDLGNGKGTIEKWLANTVASGSKGKEEWNATYLTANVFVVQYRFLRYKSEPIVYLFEVDVEKSEIVRGINNNAINLLVGKKEKTIPKKVASSKIVKQIEDDEEMF